MSLSPGPCETPDLSLLRRLVRGELDEDTFREVESHVEVCENCQTALEELSDHHFPTIPHRPAAARPARAEDAVPQVPGYRLGEPVGEGGMGVVHRAHDVALNRPVAVKILRSSGVTSSPAFSEELARRFVKEGRITGQLQHPGIPAVHQIGTLTDGRPFLAMKLIKGRTLEELLVSEVAPDAGRRLAYFEKVCEAVAYAHSRGVIHRDLKPANVMVGAFGEVQVMDWGLAKVLGESDTAPADPQGGTVITTEEGEVDRTRAGSVMGTWAYMPPEQACGLIHKVDRRSDVFALGGILCRLLTGSPPYPGHGGLQKRAEEADLADAFARLDRCGADRELTDLAKRCLAAKQDDRPADAGEVANQVTRHLVGVQVRLRRSRERQKLLLGLAASVLILTVAGFVAFGWWWQERTLIRHDVTAALDESLAQLEDGRFDEAKASLASADNRLGDGGPSDLRGRFEEVRRMLTLVEELDRIRAAGATLVKGEFATDTQLRDYPRAFDAAGLDILTGDPAGVADRVRASPVASAVVAALDHWALLADGQREEAIRNRTLEVARLAGPRTDWGDLVRSPAAWDGDPAVLERIRREAETLDPADVPPATLISLGYLLPDEDREILWKRALMYHPSDFWFHFNRGSMLFEWERYGEAAGAYRSALAVRPGVAVVHFNLGIVLDRQGDPFAALGHFRRAVAIDPTFPDAHFRLGSLLEMMGQPGEAITAYRRAVEIDPDYAEAHFSLGTLLGNDGDLDGAIEHFGRAVEIEADFARGHLYLAGVLFTKGDFAGAVRHARRAVEINPDDVEALVSLGVALKGRGDLDGSIAACRRAVEIDPDDAYAHMNLGLALQERGEPKAAIEHLRRAAEIAPDDAKAHYNLGVILGKQGDADGAIAAYRRAIEIDPDDADTHYNLGRALLERGDPEGAAGHYRRAVAIDPDDAAAHCELGAALLAEGNFDEARRSAQRVLELVPATDPLRETAQRLLEQCERLQELDDRLSQVLADGGRAAGPSEGVVLAYVCWRYKRRPFAALDLYADSFSEEPRMAAEPRAAHRYGAACAALMAARRLPPIDAAALGLAAGLRRWALSALRADLGAWRAIVADSGAEAHPMVSQRMKQWQTDPNLADGRGEDAQSKLPETERQEWRQLWADVSELRERCRPNER